MKRRNFLRNMSLASIPFTIGGIPMKVMARNHFTRLAGLSTNDRVMVILQMHGGNDGLNMVIPIEQYDQYYSRRANIAIPKTNSVRRLIELDSTLPSADQVGLHPDMIGVKELYDRGRVNIVQGVSYKNNNGSHFRGRDIWFMGGGFDDFYSSGWVGRYLQQEFAPLTYPDDFPTAEMLDPLAIELGSDVSLIFHQEGNIPTSISIGNDPERFANLINQLEGFDDQGVDPRGKPPAALDQSPYGKELNWILGLEDKSEDYAARLLEVYERAPTAKVTYPETYPFNAPGGSLRNRLTPQLQLIARLLDGGGDGVGTKVFLIKIGGFDTHADQVESYDPTMGSHAALLYHISSAMKAFQDDLRTRGIEDRVLTLTTSEFGRRVGSNGSFGTDHGTGAPVMIFGRGASPGVIGTNPDVTRNNVEMQFDYRQVYSNILLNWMQVDKDVITNDIFFGNYIDGPKEDGGNYEPLPVAVDEVVGIDDFMSSRFNLGDCYPNPARLKTTIPFRINRNAEVTIELMDIKGKKLKTVQHATLTAGDHRVEADLSGLSAGTYLYTIKSGLLTDSKKLIVKN